jgi:glycosyltransferase involved in cell wall biosynthesis
MNALQPSIPPTEAIRTVAIVVPTVGRPSLATLLTALSSELGQQDGLCVEEVLVVDDRSDPDPDLAGHVPPGLTGRVRCLRSGGGGPARARNTGWRATSATWIVFLDDDVVPTSGWWSDLAHDLASAERAAVDIVHGTIRVPLPADRSATDAERNVARLEAAAWITADVAVRRSVLETLGGFDERFPRAYREDTEFALRAEAIGCRFVNGQRVTHHPVRDEPWWASVARQRGNADDVLLSALHGRHHVLGGRRGRHHLITGALTGAVLTLPVRRSWGLLFAVVWLLGTLEFLMARLRAGPKHPAEVAALAATSVAIPPAATFHWLRGRWRWRGIRPDDRWSPGRIPG